jgi:hypothetical protein
MIELECQTRLGWTVRVAGAHRLHRPDVAFRPFQGGRLGRIPEPERRVVSDQQEMLTERALLLQNELDAHCVGIGRH